LFELIKTPSVCERHALILHLVNIAIGLDSDYLPYKFNLSEYRNILRVHAAKLSGERRSQLAFGPHIQLACYDAVNERASTFASLIESDEEMVRISSAFAACWFPEQESALDGLVQHL